MVVHFPVTLSKINVNEVCPQPQLDYKWAPGPFLAVFIAKF